MIVENYLSTNATFPITYGTPITVACDHPYKLLGSAIITCEKGKVYSHSSIRPKCVNRGECATVHRIMNLNLAMQGQIKFLTTNKPSMVFQL